MDIIKLQNVYKKYGSISVLKDINIRIEKGEIFGLLGPSGVGKSTIIKLITGQSNADKGTVEVLNNNIMNKKGLNTKEVGVVTDSFGFMERLTCYENLLLFCHIYNQNPLIIDSLLEDLNLLEEKNKKVSALSKGMRQRLHLARAMMNNPAVLVLDEPTSDIDPKTQQKVHDMIRRFQHTGMTVFLTTHNMQEAAELCDRIAIMKDGEIKELGKPEDIIEKYGLGSKILIRSVDGKEIELENGPGSAEQIQYYLVHRLIKDISIKSPNLKDIFLKIQGAYVDEK